MIDARKEQAINLLLQGELNITDIAKAIGCTRQTIYDWKDKNEEFMVELDARRQERKNFGMRMFENSFDVAVTEYVKLSKETDNAETKRKTLEYIIERGIGKIPNKTELTTNDDNRDNVNLLDNDFEEWKRQAKEDENNIH
jgi:transposase-like protein